MSQSGIISAESTLDEDYLRKLAKETRKYVATIENPPHNRDESVKDFTNTLDEVITTCASPNLDGGHRVAAWNTLCSFIDQLAASKSEEARDLLRTHETWSRALDVYLGQAHNSKPRASKQLLTTLATSLRHAQCGDQSADLSISNRYISERLLRHFITFQDGPKAKASAQLLGVLLLKDALSLDDILSSKVLDAPSLDTSFQSSFSRFLHVVFQWLSRVDFGPTIAHLVVILLDKHDLAGSQNLGASVAEPLWAEPLRVALSSDNVNVDDLRVHVFPALFKRKVHDCVAFLQMQGLPRGDDATPRVLQSTAPNSALLFPALQCAKELGILLDTTETSFSYQDKHILMPISYLASLLSQQSHNARWTGMSLLITSNAMTRPLPPASIRLIKSSLSNLFADPDADFRSGVVSIFQKLINRIRAITAASAKADLHGRRRQGVDSSPENDILRSHRALVSWLLRLLAWELRPTASYQRHAAVLKCLLVLVRSGVDKSIRSDHLSKTASGEVKWPIHIAIFESSLRQVLIDLLFDPFEDVRQTAASILTIDCASAEDADLRALQNKLNTTLQHTAPSVQLSGRADHADGYAHLQAIYFQSLGPERTHLSISRAAFLDQLISTLDQALQVAGKNLREAAENHPLHGPLLSLRYILASNPTSLESDIARQLFAKIRTVWDVVKPVLCNDAPEGYAPDELDEEISSTKQTLSYCWRALKEASSLLSVMVSLQPVQSQDETNFLVMMSDLCFVQLAELRHRGAFSTVAQTWSVCCTRCYQLSLYEKNALGDWYRDVIHTIHSRMTINTRRSAGVPSLLCGILIGDRSGALLNQAMRDLEVIARESLHDQGSDEASLPQVHAMNCVKDILKTSRLGERTERFLPTSLQLAADALCSEAWAIRNCGLMLVRVIIDRLLGTNDAHFDAEVNRQKRIDTASNPQLLDVVIRLLELPGGDDSTPGGHHEGVFPALQLLQHLTVSPDRKPQIQTALYTLIGNSSWHIRDKAAQTYAPMIVADRGFMNLIQIMKRAEKVRHNLLHGILLTARYVAVHVRLLARTEAANEGNGQEPVGDFCGLLYRIMWLSESLWRSSTIKSPVTKAASVDVLRECLITLSTYPNTCGFHLSPSVLLLPAIASSQGGYMATVRQAWARELASTLHIELDCSEHDEKLIGRWMLDLAVLDGSACSYFLDGLTTVRKGFVMDLCFAILKSKAGTRPKRDAMKKIIESDTAAIKPDMLIPNLIAFLDDNDSNQQDADQSLILHASMFEARARSQADIEIADLQSVLDACIEAIDETSIFTREAAVQAMLKIDQLWLTIKTTPQLDQTFLRLCLGLYDLLNDDDEEIRLAAADIVLKLIPTDGNSTEINLEPITASDRLLSFLTTQWRQSIYLFETALHRATGFMVHSSPFSRSTSIDSIPSFHAQLLAQTRPNTVLFAEEKQNLYLDPARELTVWSSVVLRLLTTTGRDRAAALSQVAAQTLSALRTLQRFSISSSHPGQDNNGDGELGGGDSGDAILGGTTHWSSPPTAFTLGLGALLAAAIVLRAVANGWKLHVPNRKGHDGVDSEDVRPSMLRAALGELVLSWNGKTDDSEREGEVVNVLWRRVAERVLFEGVRDRLRAGAKVLTWVEDRVDAVRV